MPRMIEICAECGDQFTVYDQGRKPIYCSQACRQKAYRDRKRQEQESKERMLNFDQKKIEETMLTHWKKPVHDHMKKFINKHGAFAYKDVLDLVALMLDENCQSNKE